MFKEQLRGLVESVEGSLGAVIMGTDGISVDLYAAEGAPDLELHGIEFSSVVKEMQRAASSLEMGPLGEAMLVTGEGAVLARQINADYFVLLALAAGGNLGKGRFKLRILVPRLAAEFA